MSRKPPARRARSSRPGASSTTRWADNDAYGHVNNTVYYEWFDSAVNAWMVEQGLLDIDAWRSDRFGRRNTLHLRRAARLSRSRSMSDSPLPNSAVEHPLSHRNLRPKARPARPRRRIRPRRGRPAPAAPVEIPGNGARSSKRSASADAAPSPRDIPRAIFATSSAGRQHLIDRADALPRSPDVAPRLGAARRWKFIASARAAGSLSGSSPAAIDRARADNCRERR